MSTINDLAVTSTAAGSDKLPIWKEADGVTRGISVDTLAQSAPFSSIYPSLDSPQFTGQPRVPTAPEGDSSTIIANTQFVDRAVSDAIKAGSYVVGGGTANAITGAFPQPPGAYTAGLRAVVKVAATNTGATTINLNGLGAVAVVRAPNLPLTANTLIAGGVYTMVYDGTNFQVQTSDALGPFYAVDTGAANSLVATISPTPAAYVTGMRVSVKALASNTGATTVNLNGLGIVPVVDAAGNALKSGMITANGVYELEFDGTYFRLSNATQVKKNLRDFGAVGDGVTDNTAAFNAALAAAIAESSGHIHIVIPAGTFYFVSPLTYSFPASPVIASITISGAGQDVTQLLFAASVNGMNITLQNQFNTFHIREMTLSTNGQGPTTCYGINIVQSASSIPNPANTPQSDITNVTLRGSDGYQVSNYWARGVSVLSASNVAFTGVYVAGYGFNTDGVYLVGGSAALVPAPFNFTNCTFNFCRAGINYGAWVQGVSVNQSNFTGNQYGIYAAAGESGLDQLSVNGCQFNCTIAGIGLFSPMGALTVTNNFFLVQNNSWGISLDQTYDGAILGNAFNPAVGSPTGTVAVKIGTWLGASLVVSSNSVLNLNTGLVLTAGAKNVSIGLNTFAGTALPINDSGTGTIYGATVTDITGGTRAGSFTTLVSSGAANVNSLTSGATSITGPLTVSQTNGIVGTTTNNNANAGAVGEYVTASATSVAITTAVSTNITSISLTAGDWDVSGVMQVSPAGGTIVGGESTSISTTSGTLGGLGSLTFIGATKATGQADIIPTPVVRLSLAGTTTVYLVGNVSYTTSTLTVSGLIRARRVR